MTNEKTLKSFACFVIRHSSFVISKEGAIAVRFGAVAEAVTQLTWVPPTAPSLLALARLLTSAPWLALRHDPGAVLLLLRTPTVSRLAPDYFTLPELCRSPEALELAARQLRTEGEGTLPDW